MRLEAQAKRRGRRLGHRGTRTEERDERTPGLGGNRQAAKFGVTRLWQPGEKRVAGTGAQRLLGSPERVTPAGRTHDRQVREVDPGCRERRRVRQVRWRDPCHALCAARERGEGREHHLNLADAIARAEDLGQAADRPASSG